MAHKIIYDALIKKYEADIADASAKITILMTETRIIPEHIDVTGEIDKLLGQDRRSRVKNGNIAASLWRK